MNIYNLSQVLTLNQNLSLDNFLNEVKITEDEFIDIVCHNEIAHIHELYGVRTTRLTLLQASSVVEISSHHLGFLRRNGELSIPSTQSKERGPIYFPVRGVAIYNYIKSHPIIPGKTTFSNLFQEI